jgi:hypothetical protein
MTTIISMMETQKSTAGCPVPLPSLRTVYARTLHRACEALGGIEQLATHLKVAAAAIALWVEGWEEPPLDVFLGAVDIVLLHIAETGPAS